MDSQLDTGKGLKAASQPGRSFLRSLKSQKWLWLIALPGLAIVFVFNYLPMFGVILAFKNYKPAAGIFGSQWAGFENFKYLFSTRDAWNITYNTLFLNSLFIITGTVGGILIALLVNEVRNKWLVKFYQSSMFLPYFISWVIVSYFVYSLLSYDMGMVNNLLASLGMEPVQWYNEPRLWPAILTIVNLWKGVGYGSVIYLAGIMGIDAELYEAATIDGANKLQQASGITLPLLSPLIITLTLMAIGRIFFADFGLFYNVTLDNGGLYSTTNVIDTYVFRALKFSGDIGMASAAGFYQAFVGFLLVLASNLFVKKINPERALF
ncbi:putative multiple-sugar transport system permease YteP [Ruminiclostridium hungatei]|uniref:Putative multiple-sugar transport system permease YteP n=1 Tax=Ruminiclostridium hungatei TaxID=48256 RepID=A0A1V4SPL9_RUMHU|nr:putative multiple-sugar transport system permease YteP [Ruminiclostridium hungatei]